MGIMKENYKAAIQLRKRNRIIYLSFFLLIGPFVGLMSAFKLKAGGTSTFTFTGSGYEVRVKGARGVGPSRMDATLAFAKSEETGLLAETETLKCVGYLVTQL